MTHDTDVLVIGSGAAGGVLAATLATQTSLRVTVVERGGHFGKEAFNQRTERSGHLFAEHGAQTNSDGDVVIRGGQCVGGGTTVNFALSFDPVRSVWQRWAKEHGLVGFSFDAQADDYGVDGLNMPSALSEVRTRTNVHTPPDDDVNDNNRHLQRGCEALGIGYDRFELNMKGCLKCGYCGLGCAYDRKLGTMLTYMADATAAGARLIHSCEVERLLFEGEGDARRVVGATGRVHPSHPLSRANDAPEGPIAFRAKVVLLCAGAIGSPVLLKRSEHPDPHETLGRGLVLHPSLPIIGLTDAVVENYRGISGTIYSDHFYASHGYYYECLFGLPTYAAALTPGLGAEHFDLMRGYDKSVGFGVMLVDTPRPQNRVHLDRTTGKVALHYRLSEPDKVRLRHAAEMGVSIMFAGGAREVVLPSEEPVGDLLRPHFTRPDQAQLCRELTFEPFRTTLTSAHAQATVSMGEDVRHSIINSRCESHWVRNLIVCDASSFPSSCGANPMLSIMTMARYQGRRIVAEWGRYG